MGLDRSQNLALKQLIDERATDLEEKIRDTLPLPVDDTTLARTGMAQDQVDDATTSAQEHLNHTLHEHYLHEMRQIGAARVRAAKGMTGLCEDCGSEIGYERLRAQPFAVRCVGCQEVHERRLATLRR